MKTADYQRIAETIPHQPGVYRFLGPEGEVIYVGKAKSLKKRIASYFGEKKGQSYKTGIMVRSAVNLEYTLVDSENDALLLENMLIKKIQPRYNVTWRDDKSYSYICVKKERFPRVFFTRQVIKDGSTYFGPYASKARAKVILEVVRKLFPLRTCALELSEKNIEKGKFKVCLEFHIKNCMGPCEGLESEEDYMEKIRQVKNILKGNFKDVRQHLNERMAKHATEMEFEKAQDIKNKLTFFDDYQGKSTVVSQTIGDVDVFHISEDQKRAYVQYLKVVSGSIIYSHTLEMIKNLNEDKAQMLILAIEHLRETFDSHSPEIIVPFEILSQSEFGLSGGLSSSEVTFTVPQRGEKKALLDLAEKNVKHYLFKKQQQEMNQGGRVKSVERILKTLQNDLNMTEVPWHIECFDNSNLHGTNPVASCVVFKNAKPSKSDYRKFNIKTVEGPNDFASMEEIVYRRYHRMIEEGQPLPQLIIIDGGKGQLSAAVKSLEALSITDKVTVIGIAKRLEEIYFPGDSIPLYINKKSESLKLIQQARNEAHRFAITFHRQKRGKEVTQTALTTIAGVGEKTAQKLLIHFGSVARLQQASQEEIEKVIGKSKAKMLMEHFGGPISNVGESEASSNVAKGDSPVDGPEKTGDSHFETPTESLE